MDRVSGKSFVFFGQSTKNYNFFLNSERKKAPNFNTKYAQ